jgi:hypothetical protein
VGGGDGSQDRVDFNQEEAQAEVGSVPQEYVLSIVISHTKSIP